MNVEEELLQYIADQKLEVLLADDRVDKAHSRLESAEKDYEQTQENLYDAQLELERLEDELTALQQVGE